MRTVLSLLLLTLLPFQPSPARTAYVMQDAAKNVQASDAAAAPLTNPDVLALLEAKLAPDVIVAKIKSARCDFDTSPTALQQLKAQGVADEVLVAMVEAPKAAAAPGSATRVTLKIPAGTVVEIEAAYQISSQEVKAGEALSFRVVNPVKVGGVVVVEPGATATGRVVKASRGGHFGRAGRLAWTMQDVTAADGTRVPVAFSGRAVGDSKGAKVATQMVLTGLALPLIAPVALLHGFKRGENAYLPAGKRFEIVVRGDTVVSVAPPQPR